MITFKSFDLRKIHLRSAGIFFSALTYKLNFWYTGTASLYVGQGLVARSFGYSQGHGSNKAGKCRCSAFSWCLGDKFPDTLQVEEILCTQGSLNHFVILGNPQPERKRSVRN